MSKDRLLVDVMSDEIDDFIKRLVSERCPRDKLYHALLAHVMQYYFTKLPFDARARTAAMITRWLIEEPNGPR